MREPHDTGVAPVPYWITAALRREVVSTTSARLAIMDQVRRERPRTISAPPRSSRWPRRGALTPIVLLSMLGMMFVATSLRDVSQRVDVTIMNSAQLIGDSVVPSRDRTTGQGIRDSLLDTLHLVEFVLRGNAVHSAAVVGDFNGWQRGATPLQRDANGDWRTRALVPRDALRYAYVIDDARVVAAPPLHVARNVTRSRPDSI